MSRRRGRPPAPIPSPARPLEVRMAGRLALRAEFVLTSDPRQRIYLRKLPVPPGASPSSIEGTSEIQRMIIGRAATGLDER
jgi:hypothetical protein